MSLLHGEAQNSHREQIPTSPEQSQGANQGGQVDQCLKMVTLRWLKEKKKIAIGMEILKFIFYGAPISDGRGVST